MLLTPGFSRVYKAQERHEPFNGYIAVKVLKLSRIPLRIRTALKFRC